jgi:IS5 family transposase
VFVTAILPTYARSSSHYSDIGRPSVDPGLMIRMLIVGYCYGIRSERKLCEEVEHHLGYRWFCKFDLDEKVPHHSTFSENRLGRFRASDVLRHIFERVVWAAMAMGLGEGRRLRGRCQRAGGQRQPLSRCGARRDLQAERQPPHRKAPKVISPSDPASAWTAKANKRVQERSLGRT